MQVRCCISGGNFATQGAKCTTKFLVLPDVGQIWLWRFVVVERFTEARGLAPDTGKACQAKNQSLPTVLMEFPEFLIFFKQFGTRTVARTCIFHTLQRNPAKSRLMKHVFDLLVSGWGIRISINV